MKSMILILAAGCVCLTAMVSPAEEPKKASFMTGATNCPGKVVWLTSLDAAKAEAAKRKVPILADFSGSDWCGWCIKLEEEVLSKPAFKTYAAKNLVLLLVDFPRHKSLSEKIKRQNSTLAEKYEVRGFPTVLLLDAEGKELVRTGYQPGGAERYVDYLQSALERKK